MTTMEFVDKVNIKTTAVGDKPNLQVDFGPIDVKASTSLSLDEFFANKSVDVSFEVSNAALHTEVTLDRVDGSVSMSDADILAVAFEYTELTMDKHGAKVRVAVDGLFDWSASYDDADLAVRELFDLLEAGARTKAERFINTQLAPIIN